MSPSQATQKLVCIGFAINLVAQQTRFVDDTDLYINKTNYINFSTIKLLTT